MIPEVFSLLTAIIGALAPVASKMLDRAMAGGDPISVLRDEHIADVIPSPLHIELAEKSAEARAAAARK